MESGGAGRLLVASTKESTAAVISGVAVPRGKSVISFCVQPVKYMTARNAVNKTFFILVVVGSKF